MTLSGTSDFELDVAEYIEEAFERCGLEVRTGYDLRTAKRSLNLMLAEWANRGLNQWTIKQEALPRLRGMATISMSADVIDVLSVVVRRSNTDYALERLVVTQFYLFQTKQVRTTFSVFLRPSNYACLKIWPVPENSTDVLSTMP